MSRGLHRKYDVRRTDGSSEPGGKHEHCAYYVLDLEHDEFAIPALKAYAKACRADHPDLAADLESIVAAHVETERMRCSCREASCPHSLGQVFTMSANDKAHDLLTYADATPRTPPSPKPAPTRVPGPGVERRRKP